MAIETMIETSEFSAVQTAKIHLLELSVYRNDEDSNEQDRLDVDQTAMNLLLGLYEDRVSERHIASLSSYYKALIKSQLSTQLPYFQ